MPDLPLVSIMTPSFNQGQFLEQTICSVLEQDYPQIEYLIIDGGSTDGSLEIIRRYADRLAQWVSEPDRGQSHAINKGLQRARGDILGWLNSDDLLLPGTVSRVVQAFRSHPDVDVVYGRLERIDAQGRLVPTPILPKDRVTFNQSLVIGECVVNQPGSFWRRSATEKVGCLDENLIYAMDYEYWIRLALAGMAFLRLDEPVARFRLSSASKTVGQTARMAVEQLSVLDRLLAEPGLSARLEIHPSQMKRQARQARSTIALHAFYGFFKTRHYRQAAHWLGRAVASDPGILFQRRWVDLAISGLRRRLNWL
ncbi:MAG: glycosyltransferase [Anaerolineales bacterium]|nr:glycosyltransferase [Anaerolineales bacterium]